ncbi:MAG: tetratricopeptide repeat protein, partial [Blastocatellia bacterium]|nr:tetratricopeptide repeat protein [Blastocatellia bacterium]
MDYFIKANHPLGQLTTLLRLAELSLSLNDDESMFSYLKKAETIARKLNEKHLLAIINSDYGNYYYSKEDLKTAESFYKKALATLDGEIFRRDVGLISLKLGEIALKKNNYSEAKRYFEASFDFDMKTKNKVALSQTFFNFARLNWLSKNEESALKNIVESLD